MVFIMTYVWISFLDDLITLIIDKRSSDQGFMKDLIELRCGQCGQSFKGSMIINYDSRVVPDWKTLHILTLGS